jgi:hypothetical protein
MRSDPTRSDDAEFLVQPLALPGVGTLTPEAGFCDGCSGCSKVGTGPGGRFRHIAEETAHLSGDDFLVQPLALPSTISETSESWCSSCKGCSAACRSVGR